ncbi:undecaprenyl-phosphate glucose phosphotransferase [Stieleria varia]|uniref:UDP-glucose:undecaprenyl-phosphate glucose-1-phosphate transferase n=1 Tax=Stieleria varia TaxID=2528005 RepID=A0A5C6B0K0_9BACT|nr:undecaprenyl-phosphate glucose phosphotransferase [Stieleria varia]TWU05693.1 UDP-glucose:undecaprenyl-phosphate glucose-1-phosphate transferase [Stieleria varia]
MQPSSTINSDRRWSDLLQPTLDAIAIMGSLFVVKFAARGWVEDAAVAMGLIAVIAFLITSRVTGLGRNQDRGNADNEITSIAITWVLTVLILTAIGFATRYSQNFARSVMLSWVLLAPAMIGLGRMTLRITQQFLIQKGIGIRRVAIAGLNELGRQTASNIDEDSGLGLKLIGFFDDRVEKREPTDAANVGDTEAGNTHAQNSAYSLSGDLQELVNRCQVGEVDTVLITLPMRAEDRIKYLLDQLSDSTASVYIVPDFFVFELLHSRWTSMGGLPAVSVFENPLFGVDGVTKRIADIFLAFCALLVAAVPMMLIATMVKLTSKGPVFFRQRRYGLDGREILVWKFRSMRTCDNGPVVKQATKDDPRITRVGAILRKTSLDELPQLFNVLEGSMSLVGPRPHASAHNEQYRSLIRGYMLRHKVKPGITGLAQVNGCRGETETIDKMERRIQWDHQYIRRWSLWLDLKILFKTVMVVWKQDTAY